jgi:outer membrane receptor protein involved in Fe transport
VERVDLIVGGAPGIDMHGRSVIANVVLKVRDKPARVATAASYIDSHGRVTPDLQFTTSDKSGGRQLDASLEVQRNIAIFPNYGYGPWTRRDETGAVLFSADERFEYDGPAITSSASYEFPLAKGRLKLSGLGKYYGETLDEDDVLVTGPGSYSFHGKSRFTQGELGAHFERTFGQTTLETQGLERLTSQNVHEDYDRPPAPQANSVRTHLEETIVRGVLRWKKGEVLTVEGSAENAWNDVLSNTTATQAGLPLVLPTANVDVRERRTEAGVSVAWKPNGKFSLDAALKAEDSTLSATGDIALTHSFAYAKPRLALTWSPDKLTQLRLRGEHEVNQIPFGAFITFVENNTGQFRSGNPDLLPTRAWVGEAVLERHFWSTADLTLTARYKTLSNIIDVMPAYTDAGVLYNLDANIGGGRETDLIANLLVPLKRLGLGNATMRGMVTWQQARIADPVNGLPRQLSNYPTVLGEWHFAQDFAQWKWNWGIDAFYRGGTTLYRPFGNEVTAPWPHVNVFWERRLKPTLALRVELQNLPGTAPRLVTYAYQGLRDRSPLLYVDDHRLSVGPLLYLRLRKSLD